MKLPPPSVYEEEQKFLQAMRDYENNSKNKYKTGIRVDQVHTLEELWNSVDQVAAKYKNSEGEKGVWDRIRNAFRKLGDHENAINGWLGLLPSESNYLSVVCGGLKFILHVWSRLCAYGVYHSLIIPGSGTSQGSAQCRHQWSP